ncbi:MAG: DUF4159 domain-containing protein [Phycisphaerae bacterium]|nr:DUF4159 domain-containing protein [Phycisphaerae bacterium]
MIVCILLCVASNGIAQGTTDTSDSADAVSRAKVYLLSRLDPRTGRCLDEYEKDNPRHGGMTALCVYALVTAGCDVHKTPVLRKSIRWLLETPMEGTYAVSLRASVLAALKDDRVRERLEGDVRRLVRGAYDNGAYTYTSAEGKAFSAESPFDNSNSQWAVLGVYAGVERGLHVPMDYWRRIEKHWRAQQQPDGGWGYGARLREGKLYDRPYGSMTAAGVATLSICRDQLARPNIVKGRPTPPSRALTKGLTWLEKNLSVEVNPRKNAEWYYFWLFSLQRVGATTGRKFLAGVDWYAQAADRLRRQQNPDGSWGYGQRTAETCFATLFLTRGEAPILLSKLRYEGSWNTRPRDAVNVTRWLTYMFERPLGWQVLDLIVPEDGKGSRADWQDGRVAYLSGTGPFELTDAQTDRLRQFVRRGGMIFSEAVAGNGEFTLDVQRIAARMFPEYRLAPLDEKHPIYQLQFLEVAPRELQVVDNGIRPLWIHSPRDVSLALELGPTKQRRWTFNLLANLYLYLTEKGAKSPRDPAGWPEPAAAKPARTIHLARVRHGGNCNPEPAAPERLAAALTRHGVKLKVSDPMPLGRIEAEQYPVAHMTGTADFTLSPDQIQALRAYLAAGGTLLADAAGGSKAFTKAFRREVLAPLGETKLIPLQSKLFTDAPTPMDRFRYRKATAAAMSEEQKSAPRLEAIYQNGRPVVIFSPDDITAGIVGYPLWGIKGLHPTTARALMTSLLLQLGNH